MNTALQIGSAPAATTTYIISRMLATTIERTKLAPVSVTLLEACFFIAYFYIVSGATRTTNITSLRATLANLRIISTIENIRPTIVEKVALSMRKLKARIDSLIELLYRSRKAIILILIVSVATIVLSMAIYVWLGKNDRFYLPNIGAIRTVGVKAYEDPDLEDMATEIQWGTIYPGASRNIALYLQSISNTNTIFELKTENWTFLNPANDIILGPSDKTSYMNLKWNYNNATVSPGETVGVSLTLSVDDSENFIQQLVDNNITQFRFDIIISAIEQT